MASGDIATSAKGQVYYFEDPVLGVGWNINPVTGQASSFWLDEFNKTPTGLSGSGSKYRPDQDYGLGANYKGVIVTKRDKNGTPTEFYAMTQGGGGQFFKDINQATSAASSFLAWDKEKNPTKYQTNPDGSINLPTGGVTTGSAGTVWDNTQKNTSSQSATQAPGVLASPGVGETTQAANAQEWKTPSATEDWYGQNKDRFNQPSKTSDWYGQNKDQYTQPSAQEQKWAGLSGEFDNWSKSGLEDVYDRQESKARKALDTRAKSVGIGDSSAAARATSNIGQEFADKKTLALQDWAKTGMTLAGAADSGKQSRMNMGLSAAGAADTADMNWLTQGGGAADLATQAKNTRLTGGQTAANQAQTLQIGRETGGLDSYLQIANGLAGATGNLTTAASNSSKDYQTSIAQTLMAKGNLSYDDAMAQASQIMSILGLGATAATTLGKK